MSVHDDLPVEDDPSSARELRIAIGAELGYDLRDRVDSVGNSPAAVQFRRELLVRLAFRISNSVGDARSPTELTVEELRSRIARSLNLDPPESHFNWLHLSKIWEALE